MQTPLTKFPEIQEVQDEGYESLHVRQLESHFLQIFPATY